MNTATKIYNALSSDPFSYGTTLSLILENSGTCISKLPNEDFIFPDKSVLRVTHTEIKLLDFLIE